MAKLKPALPALGLALLVSASAKADVFDTIPDYSLTADNTAYAEQETPRNESNASLYETASEAPSLGDNLFQMPELQLNNDSRIAVENYLEQNNIDYNSQYTTSWWEYPLNIAGSYILTLALHEFGHYTMANIFGAENVEIHFFDRECGNRPACVSYEKIVCNDRLCRSMEWRVGQLQRTLISAAGTGFTSMGNIALTALLKNDVVPDWMRSFTATASLGMMLDRHTYIWASAIKHWAGIDDTGGDFDNIMDTNFSSQEAKDAAYGVLFAASAIELALRWEEVWYLVNTAIGRQVEVPEGLGILPGMYPYGSTLMLGASGEF